MRKLITLTLLLILTSGCGTVFTRCGTTPFGIYPYQAVGTIAPIYVDPQAHWDEKLGATIDLPFDFALDTLFLFPDLVMGSCGYKKDGIGAWIH